jgi:hypothetical protein
MGTRELGLNRTWVKAAAGVQRFEVGDLVGNDPHAGRVVVESPGRKRLVGEYDDVERDDEDSDDRKAARRVLVPQGE